MNLTETGHPPDKATTSVEDAEILAEIARNDLRRFDALVNRYKVRLMRYIGHRVRDRHHAEDLTQEAFLRLFRAARAGGYSERASVSTWLFTIADNCVTDYLRAAGRKRLTLESDAIGRRDEMFREYCQVAGGSFPDSLDLMTASRAVWVKHTIQIQWEALTSQIGKGNDEQRLRFEELTFRTLDGKQNEEQMGKIRKETLALTYEITWENVAPEKVRANVDVRRKFVELMLKTAEGKPTEAQAGNLKEQIRKLGGDELWEAMQTHERARKTAEADQQKTAEAQEAQTRRFMEAQQRVQRGLHFANQLPPNADAHYVGKGVLLGAADTPVFWYRPKETKKYRVIYADLSVRDADAPPNVPQTPPVGR
jgi:RNA polymerase sigma factor (sigma-70 family)